MKAWSVTNKHDDEWYSVVWADTRNQAKVLGLGEIDADEYIDVIARRLPVADGLSWDDLTPTWWIETGHWVACDGCDGRIYGIHEELIFTHEGTKRERLYCRWECFSRHTRHLYWLLKQSDIAAERRARKQAA